MENQTKNICAMFYASHYIPVALYEADTLVQIYSCEKNVDVFSAVLQKIINIKDNPYILTLSEQGMYGSIKINCTAFRILIGPIFSIPVTQDIVSAVAKQNFINNDKLDDLKSLLLSIPNYSYNQFANLLGFLNYTINGEVYSIAEQFKIESKAVNNKLATVHTKNIYDSQDEQATHGTYNFENLLLSFIRDGEVEKLSDFLMQTAQSTELHEGKLADTPLRQAKNLLIGVATMVGKIGAIGGGLNIEETYRLIDLYIQECEKSSSTDAIKLLQYNMLLDFAERVAQNKLPKNTSKEIFHCVQFIQNHTNCVIGIDDVAGYIGKSRAYLTKKFRQETSESITDFIIKSKIKDAKRLLRYTDKTLSEISNHLCFSSQSYFQKVFKDKVGITPNDYRKEKQL